MLCEQEVVLLIIVSTKQIKIATLYNDLMYNMSYIIYHSI